jgi:hypothetical protein
MKTNLQGSESESEKEPTVPPNALMPTASSHNIFFSTPTDSYIFHVFILPWCILLLPGGDVESLGWILLLCKVAHPWLKFKKSLKYECSEGGG